MTYKSPMILQNHQWDGILWMPLVWSVMSLLIYHWIALVTVAVESFANSKKAAHSAQESISQNLFVRNAFLTGDLSGLIFYFDSPPAVLFKHFGL